MPHGVYLTLFMGISTASGLLCYVNAGHKPQFVMRVAAASAMTSTGLRIAL